MGLVTAGGSNVNENWTSLLTGKSGLKVVEGRAMGFLHPEAEKSLKALSEKPEYMIADRASLAGVLAAKEAVSGFEAENPVVLCGCSRGPVSQTEANYQLFVDKGKVSRWLGSSLAIGSVSSTVAFGVSTSGLNMTLATGCSSGLHALALGTSMIKSELTSSALVGGAEAGLTPFTIAQVEASGRYVKDLHQEYLCRPMHPENTGVVLGEGSSFAYLSGAKSQASHARVLGFAALTQTARTDIGVEGKDNFLELAIKSAIKNAGLKLKDIDIMVGDGSGIVERDMLEYDTYHKLFAGKVPPILFYKWMPGSLRGAASMTGTIFGVQILRHGVLPAHRYIDSQKPLGKSYKGNFQTALIVSIGYNSFTGNAAAVVIGKP